jgi:hypothetical protein
MSIMSFAVWVCLAAVTALLTPISDLHQPRGESHNSPFANGGTLTRRVDAEENIPARWQVISVPRFRLWYFLVELLLKLLEAREGDKRGSPSRTEVILA